MRLLRISFLSFLLSGMATLGHAQLFAPVANDDASSMNEDALPITFNITDNDTDADILDAINPASVDLDVAQAGRQDVVTTAAGEYSVDNSGNLTFTPTADFNGVATLNYTVRDNFTVLSNEATITITVVAANDPPSFVKGANQIVLEDAAAQTVAGWATSISKGPADESGQTVAFAVSNDNNALFSVQPAIGPAGTLTYTPTANTSGVATVSVVLSDDGGTANGGNNTFTTQTFTITVTSVNDAPSFVKGANQSLLEDATAHTEAGWATAISKGPADENGQVVSFAVTNDNNALFSVQPAINSTGTLTYTPAANANGAATVSVVLSDNGGTANGGVDTFTTQTFTVTVTAVNDAPSFVKGANQSVAQNAGAQSVAGWATSISKGPADENGQALTFAVTNDNNTLFSVQPAINAAGTLTYTPATNESGVATVSVILSDNGGTANGGADSFTTQTFTITVAAGNHEPSFVKGPNQTILEDAAAQTITNWATAIDKGHPSESAQVLTFTVTNDNNPLFTVQPSINPTTGTLTYTAAPNANGLATVSVVLSDDGGTANGGDDTFPTQTFTITVTAVNDAPSFVKGANQSILEDAGAQSVAGWATSISKGPVDENGQVISFAVTNDNNGLFSAQPAMGSTGTLTYTPAANANGVANVSVVLSDNGGTANGGNDTFTTQTFTITVTAINDSPSFVKGADQNVVQNAGAQTVAGWATAISKGPADESGQVLTFAVTNDDNTLFSVQPAINAAGTLTYTPAAGAGGSATVSVILSDNGGTANGGDDTFTTQTFTITVAASNHEPSFVKGPNQTVLEDAGAQSVVNWATSINKGHPSESAQVLTFAVTNDNNPLFAVQPSINAITGTLTYTPAVNVNGVATVSVILSDDGGTANGGDDTFATQTFTITVTAVNDSPSFVKGSNQIVTEDAGAQTVAAWATSISKGPVDEAGQVLTFGVTNDNNALFAAQPAINASTGNLTFTSVANASGVATVSIVLSDNGGTANGGNDTFTTQTFTITVTAVNDLPTAVNDAVTTAEDTQVNINVVTNDTDTDGTIAANTVDLDISLAGVQGSVNTAQGTFSVNAAGLVTFTPIANFSGPAPVQYTVNDNNGGTSNSATLTVTVTPVNDAPTITGQNLLVTNEEQSITIGFTDLIVSDPDNTYPTGFTITVLAGSNYTASTTTITPAANFSGTLTVPVQVFDGVALSATFNVSITVNPINDAPVITAQSALTTNEDQTITLAFGNLTVTDQDDTYPTGFSMTITSGSNYTFSGLTITPAPNFSGTLTVPVFVNDGSTNSNTFNLSITVNAVNDAPVITAQSALSLNEDQSITLAFTNLTVTDIDNTYPTGFTMTVTAGANYTVAGTTVTPNPNFVGTLTVPVRVNDGLANSNTFNLSITVNGVNDPPVITGQVALTTSEDQAIAIQFSSLMVTDVDNTYPTGFTLSVSGGSNYSVAGTTVTPAANFFGTLTVPVVVNDGTSNSNTFNLTITVNSSNDAPVITGQDPLSVNEDQSITIAFGDLNVTDADNTYPTGFTLAVLTGSNYTVSGLTVTPSPNYSGPLTVPVRVNDGSSNSNTFNLSITVNPSNDPPVITGQTALSVNEDTPITIQLAHLIVSDPDNTYPTGFTLAVGTGSNYSLVGNVVTPSANYSGPLTIPVHVNDGASNSNTFNLSVTVNPANDTPVITGQSALSVNEDNSITLQLTNLTVTDPDDAYPSGFTLTVLAGSNYTFTGNTVTPAANYSGTITVPVRVNDGSADSAPFNVSITVNPVSDPPVITGQQPLSTNEETPLTIQLNNLLVADPDNTYPTGFTLTVLSGTNYSLTGNTITPNNNFTGTLTVPVRVNDGSANSNTFNLSVTVNGLNDAPVITGQVALNMNEDTFITVLLSHLTVSDPDNSYPAGFTLSVSSGSNYSVSGNTITPSPNYSGLLSVPVTVNDGISNSASFNLQITVNAVNDVPQITGQNPLSTGESQPITISLSQLFVFDPDDTYPADFSLFVLSGSNYSVGTGNVVTPAANFSGLLLVKILVNDGSANSAIYDLQILVNSVNDPPTITNQQALNVNEDNSITIQLANLTVTDPDNTYPTGFTLTVLPGSNYTFTGNTVTPTLNFSGPLTVSVKVNDGLSDSAPFNLHVTVNPVNDIPQITGQQPLVVNEDQPITIQFANLLVADPDDTYPSGFTLTALSGTNYSLVGNTVTPSSNFSGTLTVPVRVNDGDANSSNFNLQITVDAVNDAPVITGQVALSTAEDTPIVIKLADLTVTDPDDTYPTGFTLTVSSGTNYTVSSATVTPALNFNGTLSVNVTVNDGSANSAVFPLQVQVNAVNTPPTITGQVVLTTNEDQALTIKLGDLTVNDPDNTYPNGFTLSLAAGANYTFSGPTVTPNANFSGNLTVPVRVNDGVNNSAPFNLLIRVNPVNDPPIITGQTTLTINEDQFITLALANLTVTDPDNTYPTGFTLSVASGTNYTVSGTRVTPTANFSGNLTVNVTVNDGTDNSAVFALLVKVNPINDPPTSSGLPPSTIDEDNPNEVVINLLNGFKDAEDNSNLLSYQIVPGHNATFFQSIAINQALGELRYKVNPNVFGTTNVTIKATDTGGQSVQDILVVTINPVNDAPSFDAVPDQHVIENSPPQTITLKNVTKGAFENTQTLNLFATSGNTTIVPNPVITYDGVSNQAQLTFTVQPNKSGTVTITIFAIDDGLNTLPNRNSFSSTFQIEVVEVNNQPTLDAITVNPIQEDAAPFNVPLTGITAGVGETQTLTVTASHNKPDILESVEVVYTSPQSIGSLRITPKANGSGTVQVTVTVTDSGPNLPQPPNDNSISQTFNLVVQAVNDLPKFESTPVLLATVGELYSYPIEITDVDNASITVTATQKPTWATLTVQSSGKTATLSGTPPANATGSSVVKIQAKDATGAPVVQEFTLIVNSLPVVSQIELSTSEDVSIISQQQKFTAAFSDPDLNPIDKVKILSLPNPALGSLKFKGSNISVNTEIAFDEIGELVYQPRADTFGIDTIRWNASDGLRYALQSSMIRIVIAPVNDAPIIDSLESDPVLPMSYDIGAGPQLLTEIFWASDPDYDSLESADIGFRPQNYDGTNDKLLFTNTANIVGEFNPLSGTLSLTSTAPTGKASVSEFIEFIRSVQYIYNGESLPDNPEKVVYFTLSDGKLLSETKDRYIRLRDEFEDPEIISGFTPNGDDQNDTWLPIRSDGGVASDYKDAEIRVYDKRGRLVFETIGFEKEWDGTYQGELLPSESYFFTLDLKLPFLQKRYQGVVTILR